jgi:hypothetical protein
MPSIFRNAALLSLAVPAILFLAACQATDSGRETTDIPAISPDAPRWVETGEVQGYPLGSYIRGRGVSSPEHTEADALALARVDALTQISEQIQTRVQSELSSIQREVAHNEKVESFEDVVIRSRLETSDLLAGADKVAEWYDADSGTGYVLMAMNRLKLSERLCNQASDKKKEAAGHLDSSRTAQGRGDLGAGLKSLVRARRAMAVALSNHAKALAVGTTNELKQRFTALDLGAFFNEVVQEYDKLAGTIRLEAVSGNEQIASLSGTVRDPITVRVTGKGGKPLAGFPMKIKPGDENAEMVTAIPSADGTDAKGHYTFTLKELVSTGAHSNTVTVALDFEAIEPRTDLLPLSCTVTYLMPTKETTRIAVVIHETIGGKENANSHTASFIKSALTDLGFQVIRADIGQQPKTFVNLPPKALERALGGQCEYVIVGTAESSFSSNERGFICFRTRLVIDALELESGKTIHFEIPMEQATKGFGRSNEAAARESLKKAALVMVGENKPGKQGQLGEKFVARFESGAEWEE